jgi:hypothetical protein
MLAEIDNVEMHEMESDDSWIRDTGPTFLVGQRHELRAVNWFFNAWGGVGIFNGINYVPWEKDKYIAHETIAIAGASKYRADFILEGGSIHVDGEGTVLTTEECLLNPNRNPLLTREDIEKRLRSYLGNEMVNFIYFLYLHTYNLGFCSQASAKSFGCLAVCTPTRTRMATSTTSRASSAPGSFSSPGRTMRRTRSTRLAGRHMTCCPTRRTPWAAR